MTPPRPRGSISAADRRTEKDVAWRSCVRKEQRCNVYFGRLKDEAGSLDAWRDEHIRQHGIQQSHLERIITPLLPPHRVSSIASRGVKCFVSYS